MSFKPLNGHVLLKRHEKVEERTSGGIVLPMSAGSAPPTADVIAVGEDVGYISVGDVVYISSYVGIDIEIDGEKHVVVSNEDILGIDKTDK